MVRHVRTERFASIACYGRPGRKSGSVRRTCTTGRPKSFRGGRSILFASQELRCSPELTWICMSSCFLAAGAQLPSFATCKRRPLPTAPVPQLLSPTTLPCSHMHALHRQGPPLWLSCCPLWIRSGRWLLIAFVVREYLYIMFVLSWLISLVQRSVQRPLRSGCPHVVDGIMEKRAASVILRSCQVLDTVQCASLIRPRSQTARRSRLFLSRSEQGSNWMGRPAGAIRTSSSWTMLLSWTCWIKLPSTVRHRLLRVQVLPRPRSLPRHRSPKTPRTCPSHTGQTCG